MLRLMSLSICFILRLTIFIYIDSFKALLLLLSNVILPVRMPLFLLKSTRLKLGHVARSGAGLFGPTHFSLGVAL